MIILPDKRAPKTRFLMPMPVSQWRASSQACPKDQHGREDRTVFALTGRLNDGHVAWRGEFEDRDDADAFLFAIVSGSIIREPALWRLPVPAWHPDLGSHLTYDFATVTYLTASPGSNLTYNRPVDWDDASNTVELIAGGGGGGRTIGSGGQARAGGGGGAYSSQSNITIGSTASYRIGIAGTAGTTSNSTGGTGGDSWFNGSALGSASVSAQGGTGSSNNSATTGGLATNGIGSTKFNGGTSGAGQAPNGAGGGGGGAGGGSGAGGNGTAGSGGSGGNGGAGNANTGGGGAGATTNGGTGGAGTNLGSSTGSGGGGGGGAGSGPGAGGPGGNYGGGGGGGGTTSGGSAAGAAGTQGIIVVSYNPIVYSAKIGSIAMMGM